MLFELPIGIINRYEESTCTRWYYSTKGHVLTGSINCIYGLQCKFMNIENHCKRYNHPDYRDQEELLKHFDKIERYYQQFQPSS